MSTPCYYGKYRAKVVDIQDPQKRGRIRVMCPKVLGDFKSSWCEPCVPVAYDSGGDLALPKLGEFVWVEFEGGDSNKPIYTGGLWSANKSPSSDYPTDTRYITWGNCKITMSGSTIHLRASNVYVNGKKVACFDDPVTVDNVEGYIGKKK